MQDEHNKASIPLKFHLNKDIKLLLLSLLFNLIIHLFFGFIYYNPVDFVLQFEAAKKIAQGQLLYRDIGELITEYGTLPRPQYPPLYLYTLGLVIAIIGVEAFTWQMVKLFLIIFNLLVGILVYLIVLDCLHSHPKAQLFALAALNWFLLNPSTLAIILSGFHENFMLFFVLLGFFLLRKDHYTKSGVCFGLALLVKPIAGVYMLPLLLWGIDERKVQTILPWISAGFTFLLGSAPFLLLAPKEYLNDVFFIHAERLDPSMSFYTYFYSDLAKTLLPFLFQILIFGAYTLIILIKIPIMDSKRVLEAVLPFMTIFMASNRILYPHYVPFMFPFFSFVLIFLIADLNHSNDFQSRNILLVLLLVGLSLVYFGGGFWALLWAVEGYETYMYNPLFSISACVCILGLVIISLTSLYALHVVKGKKG